MSLKLYNTLSQQTEEFIPLDEDRIKMYVCGPTVYDRPHIGNARSIVIYDMLYRLLNEIYPEVTYVRNITDVDDKINNTAQERGIPINQLTEEITGYFYQDLKSLNTLSPTIEPKVTESIDDIIFIIQKLIDNGNAYESDGNVLFAVDSYGDYGMLSNRKLDEMIAGARVDIEDYKRNPLDFILWKPSRENEDESSKFDSPWGVGRPGWHIECSAMSYKHLGANFDIHGGGADLKFPHHENEIAQSRCANVGSIYAKYWVHNGFLMVNGQKMSKSLGNFINIKDLLDKGISGRAIRYIFLSTHYRKPLDYNDKKADDAMKAISKMDKYIKEIDCDGDYSAIVDILKDDMNTPKAFAYLHGLVGKIKKDDNIELRRELSASMEFLGIR